MLLRKQWTGDTCSNLDESPQNYAGSKKKKKLIPIIFFFLQELGVVVVDHHCGILVPQPKTEPQDPAVKVPSPNHWTAREFST